jgi:hypothetical protein
MVRQIYDQLTIHAVPMLNPDGAENFQRRNAQDIDINRDVRAQTTPEGQLLVRLREEIKPDFGFNLHDMTGREMVGETKKALYLAFMAPPFNKENEDTDTRIRAKQLVVFLKNLLDPFIPDHIARYKADFMPRAFGDAMQNWGVSTVLIESGLNDTSDPHFLVKLNFLALLSSFQTLATGQLNGIDHSLYDQIPLEGVPLVDLLICNALIYNGMSIPPFKADIGINIETKTVEGKEIREGSIVDIGDLAITTGLNIIEGENLVVTPGRIARIKGKTDVKDLVKNGITTAVVTTAPADTTASEFYYSDSTQTLKLITTLSDSGFITADQIVNYTSFAAAALKQTKLGQVKRDHQADLLIFNGQTGNRLDLSRLIYVIKNGVVISMKK